MRSQHTQIPCWIICLFIIAPTVGFTAARDRSKEIQFENQHIKMKMIPRTPDQMAAFYIGRGFPSNAVNRIKQYCFITVSIRNKSERIIWLELARWRFDSKAITIKRYAEAFWQNTWDTLAVPKANRATFHWTTLPESRDLHPNEPVGGNIVLAQTNEPITFRAYFRTHADKKGNPMNINIANVYCAQNPK